jgi:hypothetical protein
LRTRIPIKLHIWYIVRYGSSRCGFQRSTADVMNTQPAKYDVSTIWIPHSGGRRPS